jgi:exoribonuclease-2
MLDEGLERRDLTALDFVTIDSASTEDMDDALYVEAADGKLHLTVAIADPTAWIAEGSKLDNAAKIRAFTNYLPGFNIPMLPRELSDDLCSLRANEVRPVLACRMILAADGTIEDDIEFFAATIESKAKLAYDDVSDWLENTGSWQPERAIAQQINCCRMSACAAANGVKPMRWCSKTVRITVSCLAKKAKCWISSPNRVASPTALSKSR